MWSSFLDSSIEDYLYSDIGPTSNIHGELGLINIPSARILDEGNLKLHLVNSDPINSLFITANPFKDQYGFQFTKAFNKGGSVDKNSGLGYMLK